MRTTLLLKVGMLLAGGFVSVVPLAALRAETSPSLISDELLDHAHLARVWQATLPLKEAEEFDRMVLLEERLYVKSDRNYVWSLDRNDGRVVNGLSVARPDFPLLGWSAYGQQVISVIDNQLVEFDKDSGRRKRVSDLKFSVVAPPVRNERFFYLSAADRRLHVLRAQNMVQLFEVAPRNESKITSILADEDKVVFGTDGGNLIAMMADAPRKLWQFDVAGAMAGPVVRDGRSFYFASKDTNVYRVDEVKRDAASLIWKYQAEAILDRPPRVTGAVVYQYALGRGLSAIDKRSGQLLWFLPKGIDLLAELRGRAYVITESNTLAVMDNRIGKQLYCVNLAGVADHAANVTDAMIYIADNHGRITCLRPVR